MPRVKPKGSRTDEDAIYVATTTAATDAAPGVIKRGTKLRGSDAVVQSCPWLFVPADVPENEWPSDYDPVIATEEAATAALPGHDLRVSALPIPVGEIVEAVRDVKLLVGGGGEAWTGGQLPGEVVTVPAGTRFSASESIVARLPDVFKAV